MARLIGFWIGLALRGLILVYRYTLSGLIGRECRFMPSCSVYADEAIRRFGPWYGGCLAVRRVLRCHPWGGSGYDPVPLSRDAIKKPAGKKNPSDRL